MSLAFHSGWTPVLCWSRTNGRVSICMVGGDKPAGGGGGAMPKPKGYYKRPSRAIEKGGGFYIPGLRGPRLRTAVSGLILVLLAANHASAGKELPSSFRVSEAIACTSALAVMLTSVWSRLENAADDRKMNVALTVPSASAVVSGSAQATRADAASSATAAMPPASTADGGQWTLDEELQWAADIILDLTKATSVVLFRGEGVILRVGATGASNEGSSDAGEVVRRVSAENRDLYVSDSITLPEGVGFPFLQEERVAAILHPVRDGEYVFVVAGAVNDSVTAPFDAKDRLWIEQVARRVGDVLMLKS